MISEDRICAVVAAERSSQMSKQLRQALGHTRTVELRLDWLATDKEILAFLRRLAKARLRATLIATCRRRQAGGRYRGTIANQLLILAEAIRAGCAWCDLEIESASKCPPEVLDVLLTGSRRIVSAHFFRASPNRSSEH
jgi:3-dehydroquinate dehydratase/shikimate dehydrogenase